MSPSSREDIQNPFKTWRFLVSPVFKHHPNDAVSLFMKLSVIVFLLATFCLIYNFSIKVQYVPSSCSQQSSQCDDVRTRLSTYKKLLAGPNDTTPTNVSHIVFGIGGSANTWNDRRHYCELWWKPGITRGYVWLDEEPVNNNQSSWPDTSPPYKVSSDTSRFKYTCDFGSRSAIRIARIVKETFELGLRDVRWFVLGDDDTVFFLENLVSVLGRYDHEQMYYIGGNSESVEQDVIHSYTMAYGGGGFAISYALAAELVRVLDGCIDRYASFYGSDQKVQGCVAEIGVPLSKELGFHQVDIRGNPYGLLAAHPLAPIVSLHHLDSVEPIFPNMSQIESLKLLMSAFKEDPDRTVQQSFCHDLTRNWTVSVSWGYTVQLYPSLEHAKRVETAYLTFKTWKNWADEPFTFNTQYRSSNPCERPIVYFLDRVQKTGKDQTLTTYKRVMMGSDRDCETKDYAPALAVKYIEVSASTLNPDTWKLAPRRQCCEVMGQMGDGGGLMNNWRSNKGIRIKIRECKPFESVTPP